MADPFSLAAGVVGLVSLTVQLFQVTSKFKDNVEGAKDEIEALLQELTLLKLLLEKLQESWENKRCPPGFDVSALAGIESTCKKQLNGLLQTLTTASICLQKKPYSSIRSAKFHLKWPLKAEKTRDMIKSLHRYYSIFSWALHHRESDILFKLSDEVCKIMKDQDKILDEFHHVLKSHQDVRQHVDAATEVANSVLRIVQGHEDGLETICEGLKNVKVKEDNTSKTLSDIKTNLNEIKADTKISKARFASVEEELSIRRNIIEKYHNGQRISKIPSIPYLERRRQAFESHEPRTGLWFLSHPNFQAWKKSNSNYPLICTGPPGAGKTVLTALAIENVSQECQRSNSQMAYLFCHYKHQVKETVPILLSSILQQLLTSERVIFPFVREKCLELFSRPSRPALVVQTLVQLIKVLTRHCGKTYLLIDAVDEILEVGPRGEDVRNMFLKTLFELSDHCQLLLTCRTHLDIRSFSASTRHAMIKINAKDDDVSAYVASAINVSKNLSDFSERSPGLREDIIQAIQLRTHGVFLLARFHILRLTSAISPRDVRDMLATLSTNLDEVYGFCLERLNCQQSNKQSLARRALGWVANAERPLTDLELIQALSFRPGDDDVDPSSDTDISVIIEACDGMLQLEMPSNNSQSYRPVVSFTHATIAEFMDQVLANTDIQLDMANTSLGYLNMEKIPVQSFHDRIQTRYHFLNYAILHWMKHAKRAQNDVDRDSLLYLARKSQSALVEAARWGLEDTVHHLLDSGISSNTTYQGWTPLAAAAYHGHLMCASYLVEAGADVNYAGNERQPVDTALTHAARSGHMQMVTLLIDANADLDHGRVPPIIAAITNSRLDIVERLLSAGCNPDARYQRQSAMTLALERNELEIAEALMRGGADLNAFFGSSGETPLSNALYYRQWDFAAKLIANGADVTDDRLLSTAAYEGRTELVLAIMQNRGFQEACTSTDPDLRHDECPVSNAHKYKTPLHLALEARNHEIAEILIKAGLGINQLCGAPPYTPLEWAAGRNDTELVEQLLSAGADPNLGGQVSPLLAAASRFVRADNSMHVYTTEVIALLLDAGADAHVHDEKFLVQLRIRTCENIRHRWWAWNDPNVRRLLALLRMPADWIVA